MVILNDTALVYCQSLKWQIDEFRGVEYSAAVADFFTYDNLRPAEDWHPLIQDIVYWGKLFQVLKSL